MRWYLYTDRSVYVLSYDALIGRKDTDMSRYTIEVAAGTRRNATLLHGNLPIKVVTIYAYGFDRQTAEYFLDVKKAGEDSFEPIVGGGEPAEFPYGNNGAMLQGIDKYKLQDLIPADHMAKIGGDLPF